MKNPASIRDKYSKEIFSTQFSNIYITRIGHMERNPYQYYSNENVRPDFCLQYVISGQGEYFVNNKLHLLKTGDLFLLPKNKPHYYKANPQNPYSYYWIHFQGTGVENFFKLISLSEENPVLNIGDSQKIKNIFKEIINISRYLKPNHNLKLIGLGYQLLFEISKALVPDNASEIFDARIEDIVNYIAENFQNKITLDDLSRMSHLSREYMISLFKKKIGTSPHQYILNYRISYACNLFQRGYTVSQAYKECGFSELTNFSVRFKQVMGVSPAEYKKQFNKN